MIFKDAEVTDFPIYRPFFINQRYPLSGYSLSSLIAWSNSIFTTSFAVHEDALIVAGHIHTSNKGVVSDYIILPVTPKSEFSPERLRDVLILSGRSWCLLVPEEYIKRYGYEHIKGIYDIYPHEEYDDYIYLQSDLSELKGNKYSKKRNLINQFVSVYVDTGRVTVETIDKNNKSECSDFLNEWCRERDCDGETDDFLLCERNAILKTLENFEFFELSGILLRIDENVSAFAIASSLTDEIASLQYEKASSEIKGLYQYFDKLCAEKMFEKFKYINKESDLGIEGLRKAKRSYHPVTMARSYKLKLKRL